MAEWRIDDLLLRPGDAIAALNSAERELVLARRRIDDLLEANDRYLSRARKAEELLNCQPTYKPLTPFALASALDCFWNAALADAQQRGGGAASDMASTMATGLAAVAGALRRGE